jgi:leucyl aminopeptidase (aminopeptidase T)
MAAKEKDKTLLYTKDVADRLKTDPKTLRRILRTLPRYKSGEEYNRYTWNESNPADKKFLASLPTIVAEHLRSEKESKEKKATAKKEAPKKVAAAAKEKKTKLPPKKKAKKAAKKVAAASAPPEEIEEEAVESTGEVESEEIEEL